MKGQAIPWSAEELAWIEARRTLPRRELLAQFLQAFDRPEIKLDDLKSLCTRKGWKTGRDGRLQPGNVPVNKGRKMPFNANSARTQFKKGNLSGTALARQKPIGAERLSKDGYLERKIHNGLPMQSRWRAVHLIEWEAVNGPIPEGHCLKAIDGNRQNTDPANWECIPRSLLPRLAGRWAPVPYDQAAPELRPALMASAQLKHRAATVRRKKA